MWKTNFVPSCRNREIMTSHTLRHNFFRPIRRNLTTLKCVVVSIIPPNHNMAHLSKYGHIWPIQLRRDKVPRNSPTSGYPIGGISVYILVLRSGIPDIEIREKFFPRPFLILTGGKRARTDCITRPPNGQPNWPPKKWVLGHFSRARTPPNLGIFGTFHPRIPGPTFYGLLKTMMKCPKVELLYDWGFMILS